MRNGKSRNVVTLLLSRERSTEGRGGGGAGVSECDRSCIAREGIMLPAMDPIKLVIYNEAVIIIPLPPEASRRWEQGLGLGVHWTLATALVAGEVTTPPGNGVLKPCAACM